MRNTPYRRAKNEERNWRRVTGNWLVITVLCFIIFELESLPDGFAAMLEDTEEIMVNLVFSAIFSLTSLLLCHFVYGKQLHPLIAAGKSVRLVAANVLLQQRY